MTGSSQEQGPTLECSIFIQALGSAPGQSWLPQGRHSCRHPRQPVLKFPQQTLEKTFFFKSSDLELGSVMLVSVSGLDEENLLDAVPSFQGSV